jgi:hypothetical protein
VRALKLGAGKRYQEAEVEPGTAARISDGNKARNAGGPWPTLADSLMLQHWLREGVGITRDLEIQTLLGEGGLGRDTGSR